MFLFYKDLRNLDKGLSLNIYHKKMRENLEFLRDNIKEPYKIEVSEPNGRKVIRLNSIISMQTLYGGPKIDFDDFDSACKENMIKAFPFSSEQIYKGYFPKGLKWNFLSNQRVQRMHCIFDVELAGHLIHNERVVSGSLNTG